MKISRKSSLNITFIFAVITEIAVFALFFLLPRITKGYIKFTGRNEEHYIKILVILYAVLLFAMIAVSCIIRLLLYVKNERVFTADAVRMLRILSWCCFCEAAVFCFLSVFYLISLVLAFAAAFLGLLMRVVKNAFEEATAIKEENDYTV